MPPFLVSVGLAASRGGNDLQLGRPPANRLEWAPQRDQGDYSLPPARTEMTPGRRALHFPDLDEIMLQFHRLLDGHTTVVHWSLAQICRHLPTGMRLVVDLPASTPHDASRWVGEEQKRQFFESGVVPEGIPTSPRLLPGEALNERE